MWSCAVSIVKAVDTMSAYPRRLMRPSRPVIVPILMAGR